MAMAMAAGGLLRPLKQDSAGPPSRSVSSQPHSSHLGRRTRKVAQGAASWTVVHPGRSNLLRVWASSYGSGDTLTSDGGAGEDVLPPIAAVTTPFHLAIPVHDVHAAREFFGGVLGCPEGRSAKTWVDFNLFGHQVVCHEVRNYNAATTANAVDGDPVPVPHFGLAMSVPEFHSLAERVRAAGVDFIIEPHIRFEGQPGEQWTMFFKDRSGNALEFKAMTTPSNLFAKYVVE